MSRISKIYCITFDANVIGEFIILSSGPDPAPLQKSLVEEFPALPKKRSVSAAIKSPKSIALQVMFRHNQLHLFLQQCGNKYSSCRKYTTSWTRYRSGAPSTTEVLQNLMHYLLCYRG